MNVPAVVFLTVLSSILILDKYAIGEFGLSQPVIAGAIIGWLCGDPRTGILIGSVFQLIFLGGLPIGRDIPPDGPGAGMVAVGAYYLLRPGHPYETSLIVAAVLGLFASIAGGALEIMIRRNNEKLYHLFVRHENRFAVVHLGGVATAFVRGIMLFLPFYAVAALITRPFYIPAAAPDLLVVIALSVGLANAGYLFFKKRTIIYVLIGGLCGLALFVL